MSPLDRRSFVARSLTVLGGAAAPAWLARAFGFAAPSSTAQDPQPAAKVDLVAWRKQQLAEALATAKAHGKPLLVLVIPEESAAARSAGQWLGGWLEHGDEPTFATLGLCKVACARLAEVNEVIGVSVDVVASTKGAVTMLLVDAQRASAGDPTGSPTTRIEVELPIVPPVRGGRDAKSEIVVRRGFTTMTESLHKGLERHGATLPALAVASMLTVDAMQQAQLDAWVRTGEGASSALLVRCLAEARLRIAELPEVARAARSKQLFEAARDELRLQPVAGARWESAWCGSYEEIQGPQGPEVLVTSCGIAFVPPLCDLFLDFYTQPAAPK